MEADGEINEVVDGETEGGRVLLYCCCNRPSFWKMVACDGENCAFEWFHQECLGKRGRKIREDYDQNGFVRLARKRGKKQEEEKVYGDNGKVTYTAMINVTLLQMQKLHSKISANISGNSGRSISIGSWRTT